MARWGDILGAGSEAVESIIILTLAWAQLLLYISNTKGIPELLVIQLHRFVDPVQLPKLLGIRMILKMSYRKQLPH